MKSTTQSYDLVIAGAGFAGLAVALACKTSLGKTFRVALVDPSPGSLAGHKDRASAIAPDNRRFLQTLGVWDMIQRDVEPVRAMVVTDSKLDDPLRPAFLTFDEPASPGDALAFMIEHDILIAALFAKAVEAGVQIQTGTVKGFAAEPHAIHAALASGDALQACLLAAADGARSPLRTLAGIASAGWTYKQSAIVATIHHEQDHEGTAYEHFLAGGPFAILPLTGKRSSIVWTEPSDRAQEILALDEASFRNELERRFGRQFGAIEPKGLRGAFPLKINMARQFIADRFALVGDAAHVIHPLAGQGLNLGLRDSAALAECVAGRARLGLDIGGPDGLETYQRRRRFEAVAMGLATDGLNRLFSNRSEPLQALRDFGLGMVDRIPAVKRFFIRNAAGFEKPST